MWKDPRDWLKLLSFTLGFILWLLLLIPLLLMFIISILIVGRGNHPKWLQKFIDFMMGDAIQNWTIGPDLKLPSEKRKEKYNVDLFDPTNKI